jgi:AmiR/NasT family two-component response regulator
MNRFNSETSRVIIAEDDPLVANVIENELEDIGAKVVGKAADGRQAVELTKSLKPDVVLMDIEMPEMNGLLAAREIQDQCPTPVIILSVYSERQTIDEAVTAGVAAFLLKPPYARELERAILIARARFADLMELRRVNAELQQALKHVKRLQGLLPICMYCHKIRTDQQSWQRLELYISEHSDASFTHGLCPECAQKHYPEIKL